MQSKLRYHVARLVAVVLLPTFLFSFSSNPGGEHFEIYLNKKLILQQLVSQSAGLKSLTLDHRNANDEISIFYSHCGQTGSQRTIMIKEGNKVLKQWRFSNAGSKKLMSVAAKELLSFQSKAHDRILSLVYTSEQLPEGRLLASVILSTHHHEVIP